MTTTAIVEGKLVKVGDIVGFKSDFEQYGRISKIERNAFGVKLTLTACHSSGFEGAYLYGAMTTTAMADRCWVD